MSKLEKTHAATVNTMARIFGVMAIVVGIVFTIWGLSLVVNHNATININGVPGNDPWIKAIVLVTGLFATVIGVLMFVAKPYQPKE